VLRRTVGTNDYEVADGPLISVGFEAVYIGVKFKELGRLFAARLSLETRILAVFSSGAEPLSSESMPNGSAVLPNEAETICSE
jgi:hypothetical protein